MKHFGDITKLSGHDLPIVDIITGGSPCQDLSCAGKRAGLSGARSGLFMDQIRIVKEMRDEFCEQLRMRGADVDFRLIKPRFMVWENVPGAFSSNKGEDFQIVLEETAKIADEDATIPRPANGKWQKAGVIIGDRYSLAWRVHDAQFWGVPQRRKRIALVADFGGESAPEILFERKGLSRNIEESRKEGQGAATNFERSIDKASGVGLDIYNNKINGNVHFHTYHKQGHPQNAEQGQGWEETNVNDTLNIFDNSEGRTPTLVLENHPQDSRIKIKYDGVFQTMGARQGGESDPHTLLVLENHPADSRVKISEDGVVQTLSSRMGTGGGNVPMVMEQPISLTTEMTPKIDENGVAFSLRNRDYKDPQCVVNSIVRRLTPLECERLQGFPDGWTDIGEWVDSKGKKHKDADSPRYKALGNSIAVGYANDRSGFWCWMARRMVEVLREGGEENPTMASLFDGIGGFPLAFSACGCRPVWASEIEEFPMAVTKIRFPEDEEE